MTWVALAGGPAAWTAQLLGSWLLLDFGCARGAAQPGALTAALLALSLGCGVIAAAATLLAAQRAPRARAARRGLYTGAALLNALSLVTIVFGLPLPLAFTACAS